MSNSNPSFSNEVLTAEGLREARDTLEAEGHLVGRATFTNVTLDSEVGDFFTGSLIFSNSNYPYGGCQKCSYFSQLFGGSSGDRKLDSEEKFEIAKGEFVEHFNEEHKDIIMKRREMPKKDIEFTKQPNGRGIIHGMSWGLDETHTPFGESMFTNIYNASFVSESEVEYVNGVAIVPSKKKKPKVNVRNLDRNARFRARIAHPQIQQDAQVMAWRNRPQVIFADEGIYQPVVTSEIRFENDSSITVPTNEERATEVDRERIVELYGGRQTGRTTMARIQNEYNRRSEED